MITLLGLYLDGPKVQFHCICLLNQTIGYNKLEKQLVDPPIDYI